MDNFYVLSGLIEKCSF